MKKTKNPLLLLSTPVRIALYCAAVLVVLAAVILFVAFRDTINSNTLRGVSGFFSFGQSGADIASFQIDKNSVNQYELYGKRLAVLSPERLVLYDRTGQETMSSAIKMQSPMLVTGTDTVIVYDRGGTSCIIADSGGIISEGHDAVIEKVVITDKDHYAILQQQSGYRGMVLVYSDKHSLRFKWHSTADDSGFIVDMALTANGSHIVLATVRQDEKQLISRLTFHRTDREEPESFTEINGQLIIAAYIMGKDTVCVLLETEVRFYTITGELKETYYLGDRLYYGVKVTDQLCALRTGRQTGEYISQLTLLSSEGLELANIALDDLVDDMDAAGGYIALLQNKSVSVYNISGEQCFIQENQSDYKKLLLTGDGSLLLIAQEQAHWVR